MNISIEPGDVAWRDLWYLSLHRIPQTRFHVDQVQGAAVGAALQRLAPQHLAPGDIHEVDALRHDSQVFLLRMLSLQSGECLLHMIDRAGEEAAEDIRQPLSDEFLIPVDSLAGTAGQGAAQRYTAMPDNRVIRATLTT